jgi:Tol biopolymer transport system component
MLLGLIGWVITRWRRSQPLPPIHLAVALPGLELFRSAEQVPLAISPDGQTIALTAIENGKRWLFLRRLDSSVVRKVDGTEGAISPFWSSDGAWIGYSTRGKLWKTKLSGGAPHALCDTAAGATGTWQGDTILFTDLPGGRNIVYRVPASGGTAVPVTTLNGAEGEGRHSFPHLLPDGKHFLYVASVAEAAERRLMLGSLESPLRTRLATNVSLARSMADRLFFVREGKLIAQPFDVTKGLTGDPQTIVDHVGFFLMSGRAEFDVSTNGVVIYATRLETGRLVVADRAGAELRVMTDEATTPYTVDVSPDGKRAAVTVSARTTRLMDIWVYDLARDARDRLTSDPGVETTPVWAPDGRSMIYSAATGRVPVLAHRVLATGATTLVGGPGAFQTMGSFTPDGKSIYYMAREGRSVGIVRMALDSKKAEVVVDDPSFWEREPQVSPDGRRLAFVSDASGPGDVYLQVLASGERVRISTRGGGFPRWRADSGELFYVSDDNVVVSVTPRGGRWDDAASDELFRARNDLESFDALPDGRSFLLSERIPSPSDALIHVIKIP